MNEKAIILVSGGMDSATCLAIAKAEGYSCYALSFDYGQQHRAELDAATRVGQLFDAKEHKTIALSLSDFGGSALTDESIPVPDYSGDSNIPLTYVPARNTVFLSIALAWAEVLESRHIFIGVSSIDYSGYPDCRPEFIDAFQHLAQLATKAGVEGNGVTIHTPLIHLSKAETIRTGIELGVDYGMTVSCYQPDKQGAACGRCDSCVLRRKGFESAEISDPTHYMTSS